MLNFLKKKREKLKEQPLGYWEEDSYMAVMPMDEDYILDESAIYRVRQLPDVKLTGSMLPVDDEGRPGKLFVEYLGEEYEFSYFYFDFNIPDMYIYQTQFFSDDEVERIKKVTKAVTGFMKFGGDVRASYVLQLKLLSAIVPDALAFQDESAEKLLNKRWVDMTIKSSVPCEYGALYSVQAIGNNENDVWLHTHGLARCNISELELLQSNDEMYDVHYNVISAFANRILEGNYNEKEGCAVIGQCLNGEPIVVTKCSWTEGILEYDRKVCGTENERKISHNAKRDLIFFYLDNSDEKHMAKDIDENLKENPIFYYSTEETERMRAVAHERFSYVRDIVEQNDKENTGVIIKMGLKTDSGQSSDDKEHIWFELLEINGDILKLKLTQEPYDIKKLHEGDEGEYNLDDMTDWIIYCKKGMISPAVAYLLDM